MNSDIILVLPRLMTQKALAERLDDNALNFRSISSNQLASEKPKSVDINWTETRFFDDIALLKLILLEYHLRKFGVKICHNGLSGDWQKRGLIRQLWACGYFELLSSCQLWGYNEARLGDISDFSNINVPGDAVSQSLRVMRIVSCHDKRDFGHSSRTVKRIREFAAQQQRKSFVEEIEAIPETWALIQNGQFRGLILDQARWNVFEHANASTGLAMIRIVNPKYFHLEWSNNPQKPDDIASELIGNGDPFSVQLERAFNSGQAFLMLTAVDDGKGFRSSLEGALKKCLENYNLANGQLFSNNSFHKRFNNVTKWKNLTLKCMAFATDPLGSSKDYRPPGPKGLTTMVDSLALLYNGQLWLSSNGWSLNIPGTVPPKDNILDKHLRDTSENAQYRLYGEPNIDPLAWMPSGRSGCAISLMAMLGEPIAPRPKSQHNILSEHAREHSSEVSTISVARTWELASEGHKPMEASIEDCSSLLCAECTIDQDTPSTHDLVVLDWSEMPIKKDILRGIASNLGNKLVKFDQGSIRPFVFAQLSEDILPILDQELCFTRASATMPICAFVAGSSQPYWLGINYDNALTEKTVGIIQDTNHDPHVGAAQSYAHDILSTALSSKRPYAPPEFWEGMQAPPRWRLLTRTLLSNSPLFVEETMAMGQKEERRTGRFSAVVQSNSLYGAVSSLFLNMLNQAVSKPPVLFEDPAGIKIKPYCVVNKYYRCDALVDLSIGESLAEELVDIALGFAKGALGERIDYIVSCTSPTHWFVHRIADGLTASGVVCGHHVFESPSSLFSEAKELPISPSSNVLVFTDVISSGRLISELGNVLQKELCARLVGLIALIDTRTNEERAEQIKKKIEPCNTIYKEQAVVLLRKPTTKRSTNNSKWKWYIHAETATPRRAQFRSRSWKEIEKHFMFDKMKGAGPAHEYHSVFKNAALLIKYLTNAHSLRIGHFQHGQHHSIAFCDIRRAFQNTPLREAIEHMLFDYVLENGINLIICPNHSSAYLLRDAFALRFPTHDGSQSSRAYVRFATASRTMSITGNANYILTTLDPEHGGQVDISRGHVLVIDDGVCTGDTLRSFIARISQLIQKNSRHNNIQIHIICFVNRLSRGATEFFQQLSHASKSSIVFSSLFTLPVRTYKPDECPLCCIRNRLHSLVSEQHFQGYEKIFYNTWIEDLKPADPYEAPWDDISSKETNTIDSHKVHKLISGLCAIEVGYTEYVDHILADASLNDMLVLIPTLLLRSKDLHLGLSDRMCYIDKLIQASDSESEKERLEVIRIIMASELYDRFPAEQIVQLGEKLIQQFGSHTTEDTVLGGIAAFLRLSMILHRNEEEYKMFATRWQKALVNVRDQAKNALDAARIGLVLHDVRSPNSRLGSVPAAIRKLYDTYSCQRPYHIGTLTTLETAQSLLTECKSGEEKADPKLLGTVLRRAITLLEEMVEAAEVISGREVMEAITTTRKDLSHAREASDIVISENIDDSEKEEHINDLWDVFHNAYTTWFRDTDERSKLPLLPQLTKPYLIDPLNIIRSQIASFADTDSKPAGMHINIEELESICSGTVLCDVDVLKQLLAQILDNMIRHWDHQSEVNVHWIAESINRDEISIKITNTGTIDFKHNKGGLYQSRDVISEYGGMLDWGMINSKWFVKIRLTSAYR